MTVARLMNSDPVTLTPTDTVATAARHMVQEHLRYLPVVDDQGRYVGTFNSYSLIRLALPRAVTMRAGLTNARFVNDQTPELSARLRSRSDEPVVNWLSKDPVLHPDDSAMDALIMLLEGHIGIPVVDRQTHQLCGWISSWNVIDALTTGPQ